MDGYSIKEAATVLGVPKRRVWELIARGVLSGAPEGDGGMRVFLQPRPGRASPLSAGREEPPPRTNGNGGHAESGEGSPFREILTEFRSLTERYGQALLALGEARGEVAALRSRVELLEARLDLRLPGPRPSSTVAWEMPEYTPPAAPAPEVPEPPETPSAEFEPPAEAEGPVAEAEPPVVEADEEAAALASEPTPVDNPPPPIPAPEEARPEKGASRRRRVLRSHSAFAGFAEALERAQDPTLADLPGAREAAEALAALQRDVEARTETLEPTPIYEAAATSESQPEAEPMAEATFVEPAAATSAQELVDEESPVEQPMAAAIQGESDAESAAVVGEASPDAAPPVDSAPSPYTTEVVEPDWFADGDFTWLEAAQADSVPADEADAGAPEQELAAEIASSSEVEERGRLEMQAEAAPAAEAIQDAFEPAEPHVPEPETAAAMETRSADVELVAEAGGEHVPEPETTVVMESPSSEAELVAEAGGERPDEQGGPPDRHADQDQVTTEAAPSAAAIQDAFDGALESADLPEAEAEPHAEPEVPEAAEDTAEAVATIELEPDAHAATDEAEQVPEAPPAADSARPDHEAAHEDAGPAAEAIQDAFEPPEPAAPAAEAPATATTREEPFAPADVTAFAVDQSEPEGAGASETDVGAERPDARAESTPIELPPEPPRAEGLGRLAVRAAALPAVQPSGPTRPEEEELMWLGDEFEAAEFEIAAPGWHSQPEGTAQPSVEPSVEPVVEVEPAQPVEQAVEPFDVAPRETHDAPAHGMSDSELEQIAQDEGWDADEVDAIRTLLGRPTSAPQAEDADERSPMEGSAAFSVEASPPDDVHPMAEVSASADEPEPPQVASDTESDTLFEREPMAPPEWSIAETSPETSAETTAPETVAEAGSFDAAVDVPAPQAAAADTSITEPDAEPAAPLSVEESIRRSIAARPAERLPAATDPDWLRSRRGPAARAYRRLRRLLPG